MHSLYSVKLPLVTVALLAFVAFGVSNIIKTDHKLRVQDLQLKSKAADLKSLQLQYDVLNRNLDFELQQKDLNKERVKELEDEKNRLQKDLEATQRDLEAKRLKTQQEQEKLAKAATLSSTAHAESGCGELRNLLIGFGVSGSELEAAIELASLESSCSSQAQNPSSGACNYYQELPCGKWGGLGDVNAHVRGAIAYCRDRYGTFQNALATWRSRSPSWW